MSENLGSENRYVYIFTIDNNLTNSSGTWEVPENIHGGTVSVLVVGGGGGAGGGGGGRGGVGYVSGGAGGSGIVILAYDIAVIPEPTSLALLALGSLGLLRRQRNTAERKSGKTEEPTCRRA